MDRQRQEQRGESEPGDHSGGADRKRSGAETDGPGSETERFRALVDVAHNEAVTGESGVPPRQRDHEQRCQEELLDEFS
jgi:hypothetical protein